MSLNGEPLKEVDCFKKARKEIKYLLLQVAADGECERNVVHRMYD